MCGKILNLTAVEGPIATQPEKGYIGNGTIPKPKNVQKVTYFLSFFKNRIYPLSCLNEDWNYRT